MDCYSNSSFAQAQRGLPASAGNRKKERNRLSCVDPTSRAHPKHMCVLVAARPQLVSRRSRQSFVGRQGNGARLECLWEQAMSDYRSEPASWSVHQKLSVLMLFAPNDLASVR
jgi:hypothetical protein